MIYISVKNVKNTQIIAFFAIFTPWFIIFTSFSSLKQVKLSDIVVFKLYMKIGVIYKNFSFEICWKMLKNTEIIAYFANFCLFFFVPNPLKKIFQFFFSKFKLLYILNKFGKFQVNCITITHTTAFQSLTIFLNSLRNPYNFGNFHFTPW